MDAHARIFQKAVSSSLILSLLVLAGCNKPGDAPPQTGTAATAPPQPAAAAPYTPPTAEQLSQMVAPIALFPDKLVGQVLAGATYPEQIAAANQWLGQYPALKGDALQTAEANQPWDVSVKALTTFPTVLSQMANNPQWTTALGEAYVNDPGDVMNAIQLLRSRAQQSGNLKSSQHLRVSTVVRPSEPAYPAYATRSSSEPVVYDGPAVIPPPPQTIVIEPAAPDVVYVPQYNPTVVYGAPMPVYPGWVEQRPAYDTGTLVTTGALSFGIGVLVGAAVSHHHDWGWNAWGVNWGGPAPYQDYGGGWHRPAVVYNNTTYVSKSVTVVNRVNNINVTNNNYRTTNNINNNVVNRTQNYAANNAAPRPPAMINAAHFAPSGALNAGANSWFNNGANNRANNGSNNGSNTGANARANIAPHAAPNFAQNLASGPAHNMASISAAHSGALAANVPQQRPGAMMTMPHFTQRDAVPGARPLTPAAAQPNHLAAASNMQQLAAPPHNPPTPALMARDARQPQQMSHDAHPSQQLQQMPHDAHQPQQMQAQHDPHQPQSQQWQPVQHDAHQPQQMPLQHDQHQPLQAARMASSETVRPVREERSFDRAPASAQAQLEHQHADVMAQRLAQERNSAAAHVPPAAQSVPVPHRDANLGQGQPQGNHQQMHAMQSAPPRPVEQHPASHMEQHQQSAHNHDKHDPHEKHG